MIAARIHEFGANIKLDNIKAPKCPENFVKIKIFATSINHLDLWVKKGIPGIKIDLPFILGSDASGCIVEVGKKVNGWKISDKVIIQPGLYCSSCYYCSIKQENLCDEYGILGETHNGTHCEYIVLDPKYIYKKFNHLTYEQAAAIPLTFMTAYEMLISKAMLKKNETILIYGGASGVGNAAIKIAKSMNVNIISTVGSRDKIDIVKKTGANFVLLHNDKNFVSKVRDIVGKKGIQVVFEHIGLFTWDNSMKLLSKGGRVVTCGATTGSNVSINLQHLFYKQQKIIGSTMSSIDSFKEMLEFVDSNRIMPTIDKVIDLNQLNDAYKYIINRKQKGKIIVSIDDNSKYK